MREMKDSGEKLLEQIPDSWGLVHLKYLCDIQTGNQDTQDANPDGEYDFYVRSPIVERSDTYTFEGDGILMAGDGAGAGRVFHHAFGKYAVHQRVYRISNYRDVQSEYLFYYLSNIFPSVMDMGSAQSTVPSVRLPMLQSLNVCLPSLNEQHRISTYLDAKCAEIDALTADIQSQIDTLEQYKRSVITEAVTKGLNKNVEKKESGSQYWGDIPVKWDIVDIKYLFEIVKRIAGHEGYDILSITQHGIKVRDTSTNEGQVAADYSNYQFLYPGEYAMNHMDLLTGWVDLSDKFGVTSPDYRVFRLRDTKRNSRRYYKYIMQICYMCRIFYSLGNGVSNLGRWRLQTSSFNNFKVPVPPYEEQEEISDYLDAKIREIEATIEIKNEQLSTLDLFKKSLIYEYVTGKKEVPD